MDTGAKMIADSAVKIIFATRTLAPVCMAVSMATIRGDTLAINVQETVYHVLISMSAHPVSQATGGVAVNVVSVFRVKLKYAAKHTGAKEYLFIYL